MAFLGHYRLGDEVPLLLLCASTAGVPTAPDAPPLVDIYDSDDVTVGSWELPPLDQAVTDGLFYRSLFLDDRFAAGNHTVVYRWLASGDERFSRAAFTVAAGGDAAGRIIAMASYIRPQAHYLIHQCTSGSIYRGKNPRL